MHVDCALGDDFQKSCEEEHRVCSARFLVDVFCTPEFHALRAETKVTLFEVHDAFSRSLIAASGSGASGSGGAP